MAKSISGLLAAVFVAGLLLVATAAPANAGTVLNRIVQVYHCSVYTGRCRYVGWYQSNPPYNGTVGVTYVRENRWVWYWI